MSFTREIIEKMDSIILLQAEAALLFAECIEDATRLGLKIDIDGQTFSVFKHLGGPNVMRDFSSPNETSLYETNKLDCLLAFLDGISFGRVNV